MCNHGMDFSVHVLELLTHTKGKKNITEFFMNTGSQSGLRPLGYAKYSFRI